MKKGSALVIAGVLMICLLVSTFFMAVPYLGLFGIGLAVGAFVYLGTRFLMGSGEKRYTDQYDLNLLKDIHERKTFESVDNTRIPDDADVVCPHCGHIYGHKFKVCPNCKLPP